MVSTEQSQYLSPSDPTLNALGTPVAPATSPKTKTWKVKVAKQWKKIHKGTGENESKGTSSPHVVAPVAEKPFSICLKDFPGGESNPFVPRILEYGINLVETKGIEQQGLYRIPGNRATVSALFEQLAQEKVPCPEEVNFALSKRI